jgi:hypothetical protein
LVASEATLDQHVKRFVKSLRDGKIRQKLRGESFDRLQHLDSKLSVYEEQGDGSETANRPPSRDKLGVKDSSRDHDRDRERDRGRDRERDRDQSTPRASAQIYQVHAESDSDEYETLSRAVHLVLTRSLTLTTKWSVPRIKSAA